MNVIRTSDNKLMIDDLGQELRNQFSYVQFDPGHHRYFDENQVEYTSVSAVLKQFTPTFDAEFFSAKVARDRQVPVKEVKSLWDIRRDYSVVRGTEFHLYVETYLNHGREIEVQTPIQKELDAFHRFWEKIKDRYQIIATELIIADRDLRMAGTIDCLMKNKETGKYFMFDWKTNREIKRKNQVGKKLLPPLEKLDDCHYNAYGLQLSIYQYLLNKNTRIDISEMHIIHFMPEGGYSIITPNYLEKEVTLMIGAHKEQRGKQEKQKLETNKTDRTNDSKTPVGTGVEHG